MKRLAVEAAEAVTGGLAEVVTAAAATATTTMTMIGSIVVYTMSTSSSNSTNSIRVVIMIGSRDCIRLRKVRPYRERDGPIRSSAP